MNATEIRNATFLALSKTTGNASDRDAVSDGSAFKLSATVRGTINGYGFELDLDSLLTVGHGSTRAGTTNPQINAVVAAILGKLNGTTREAVKRDILAGFAETQTVDASAESTKEAEEFLSALRQQVTQPVRGSVKCQNISSPSMSIRKRRLAIAA